MRLYEQESTGGDVMYPECIGCNHYQEIEGLIEEEVYSCDKELIPDDENSGNEPDCYGNSSTRR